MGIRAMRSDVYFGMHTPQHMITSDMLPILFPMHTGPLEWED